MGKPEKIFYLEDSKKSYKTLNGFLKSIGFDKVTQDEKAQNQKTRKTRMD